MYGESIEYRTCVSLLSARRICSSVACLRAHCALTVCNIAYTYIQIDR